MNLREALQAREQFEQMRILLEHLILRAEDFLPSDTGPAKETLKYSSLLGESSVGEGAVEEVIEDLQALVLGCTEQLEAFDSLSIEVEYEEDE